MVKSSALNWSVYEMKNLLHHDTHGLVLRHSSIHNHTMNGAFFLDNIFNGFLDALLVGHVHLLVFEVRMLLHELDAFLAGLHKIKRIDGFGSIGQAYFSDTKSNTPVCTCDCNHFVFEGDLPILIRSRQGR